MLSTAFAVLMALPAMAAAAQAPNVLFILADDLGPRDLARLYPTSGLANDVVAPNLERLAADGLLFTQAYAGPVCAPSRCTLMTGRHNGHCTVRGNDGAYTPLLDTDVTVAKVMQDAGYHTRLHGKWGLGNNGTTGAPQNQGFDVFVGYDNQVACHNWYPYDTMFNGTAQLIYEENNGACRVFSEDVFVNSTIEFLQRCADASSGPEGDKPFFLFLSFVTPHAGDCSFEGNSHVEPAPYAVPTVEAPYSNSDWSQTDKDYASAITRQDRDIGTVLDALAAAGLADDTVVFFASDNGAEETVDQQFGSEGPYNGYKRSLFEGGWRTPLIVRWPNRIAKNQTTDQIVSFLDVLPTVAAIGGAASPGGIDGVSFLPTLLQPGSQPQPKEVYTEFCHQASTWVYGPGFGQAIRMGEMKGIRMNRNYTDTNQDPKELKFMLFNLTADIGETKDLSGSPASAPTVAEMAARMDANHAEDPYWPSGPDCCDHKFSPGICVTSILDVD